MLAYINQEEADLLKARGGSGEPHADTGVPSFEVDPSTYLPDFQDNEMFDIRSGQSTETSPQVSSQQVAPLDLTSTQAPAYQTAGEQKYLASQSQSPSVVAPSVSYGDFAAAPSGSRYTDENISGSLRDSAARAAAAPTQDKDLLGQASKWFGSLSDDTKKRLGIASITGLIGAYQSQQAAEQGRKAKEEMQRMAQPYQQQGKRLIEQAQRGELSPVGQQQLQAVQTQAAQGAQARGGVGAQQAQAQVEAYRQQLLQGQYDLGLKVSGIGDNIAMGAIKTGLEADRYVNQLTSNYFTNIARTAYGQAPQVAGSPTYVRAEG
jgi:hypothetical protein